MENNQQFEKIINDENFKVLYKELLGDKNKILSKEFKEAAKHIPILYNKQFYYHNSLPNEMILSEYLLDILIEHYKSGHKIQNFLIEAINL